MRILYKLLVVLSLKLIASGLFIYIYHTCLPPSHLEMTLGGFANIANNKLKQ